MHDGPILLITLGALLLLGLLTSAISRHTVLPRVTLLLLFGILIGGDALDLVPEILSERFDLIADVTLIMVGFLLGGKLTKESIASHAKEVMWISAAAALLTAILVGSLLYFLGLEFQLALLLGVIASATAPAPIVDVINEMEAKGKFAQVLLMIVAVDDIWALLLFGIGMAIVGSMNGHAGDAPFIVLVSHELGGALLLGAAIGFPAAYLTGRLKPGQPILSEALGIVLLGGGLAMMFEVSYLITAITIGAIIANLASHHEYAFHDIEETEGLFLVVFFVLAGASLDLSALSSVGMIGGGFVLARTVGKYLGSKIGAQFSRSDRVTKNWMGIALLPQAGVPIGMALVAASAFPEYRQVLLSVVIASTVFFDLIGPIITRRALIIADRQPAR